MRFEIVYLENFNITSGNERKVTIIVFRIYNLKRLKLFEIWLTIRKEFLSTGQRVVSSFGHLLPFNE